MIVLVTGGQGLVGQALQEVVQSNPQPPHCFLSREQCDLVDEKQVEEMFDMIKPGVVVHLAAKVGGVYDNLNNNYDFLTVNNKINTNVLQACKKYKVRKLINILSTCIFPDKDVVYPLTSDQLHNGKPHYSNIGYAYAKRLLHVASEIMSKETGIKVVNIIPTNLYGANDNYNLDCAHVIPALIHKTYLAKTMGTPLHIKGNGLACRQFLFANDLAKIIHMFAEMNISESQVTCIVAPPESHEVRISNLVQMIARRLCYNGEIIFDTEEENGQLKKTVDDTELKKYIPNFRFTDLNRGLTYTIEHFVDNFTTVRK